MLAARAKQLAAVLVAATAGAAFFVAPSVGGPTADASGKTKVVSVGDDFFAPGSVKIGKNSSINWVWSNLNFNSHNVRLAGHPKGVKPKQFKSPATGSIGLKFKKKFTVAGNYEFYCSLHATVMRMTVKVGK